MATKIIPRPDPTFLSVNDAARHLGGMSRSTVYELLNAGRLTSVKVGARRLIPLAAIKALAAEAE